MPYTDRALVDKYVAYTYPYEVQARIDDIKEQIKVRKLDGLIHYTQTFCFRQMYDIILRDCIDIPILTLEGDRPGKVDGRTGIRIEAFVDMIKEL